MPVYAVVNPVTGLVVQQWETVEIFIEIPEKKEGRFVYHKGKIVPAPEVRLTAPEKALVANVGGLLGFAVPREWEVEAPREFTLCLNRSGAEDSPLDRQGQLYPALYRAGQTTQPITIYEAGEYEIMVIGPAPWASNKLRLTVLPAAGEG